MTALASRVREALEAVMDPCSIATRHPLSIVDLGLLVDLNVDDDGEVRVLLRATSPSCVLIGSIMEAAEERVSAVEGVSKVRIELDPDASWTPALMPDHGREKLGAARARTITKLGVRPRARPGELSPEGR